METTTQTAAWQGIDVTEQEAALLNHADANVRVEAAMALLSMAREAANRTGETVYVVSPTETLMVAFPVCATCDREKDVGQSGLYVRCECGT